MRHVWKKGTARGFTLIELVAVMAIMAILVAIVAPAVVDTRDTSVRAQAQGDAKQVNNLAAEYYGDRNEAEVRTPHTTAVGAIDVETAAVGTDPQQEISSRWPERFITNTDTTIDSASTRSKSSYRVEFEPTASPVKVVEVTLLKSNNVARVGPVAFLTRFTAVDFAKLGGDTPSSATLTTRVVGIDVHNFLWLFEKDSSGSGLADDVRTAAVFQLTGTEIIEAGGSNTVRLTYKQILGPEAFPTVVRLTTVNTGDYAATGTQAYTGTLNQITSLSFRYKHTTYANWPGPRLSLALVASSGQHYMAVTGSAKQSLAAWKTANAIGGGVTDWDTTGAGNAIWWYGTWNGSDPTTYNQAAGSGASPVTFSALQSALTGATVQHVAVYMGVVTPGAVGAGSADIEGININGRTHGTSRP